jgi:hypothetical protein
LDGDDGWVDDEPAVRLPKGGATMGMVWLRWRAELRAQWRTVVVLALLVGMGGGVALTAFAGARRTDTAVPRFVHYSLPDDGGFLYGNVFSPPVAEGAAGYSLALGPVEQRVVDLPQVAAYFRAPYLFLATDPAGNETGGLNPIGPADAALYRKVDRPFVVAGRLPDPTRPFDATVNELAAAKRHLHVGSTVLLYAYSFQQFSGGGVTVGTAHGQAPAGPSFAVRITAIVRFPTDVNAIIPLAAKQDVSYEGQQNLYLSPAFLPRLAAGLGIPVQRIPSMNLIGVRLHHGTADWLAFAAAATAIGAGMITASPGDVYGIRTAAASAERGVHLEVVALLLVGALAALITLLLVGQAIARDIRMEHDEYATLRSLGVTRVQLVGVVFLRVALIGLAGGVLAFVVAIVASPLMPVGLARRAEIHPGFEVNVAILVPGFLAIVALVAAWSLPAWRVTRRSADGDWLARRSPVADAVARTSLPPAAAVGVRFGLESGRGRTVPVATAMLGAVVAVTTTVAALTFGNSLEHLVNTPRQQGWNWDVIVGNPNDQTDREAQAGALLARNPLVGAYSAIAILAGQNQGTAVIDGKTVDSMLAIDPMKGSVYPPLLEGHAPRADNEIVLATHTLHRLRRHVGGYVQIPTPEGVRTLRIAGRMISPSVGDLLTNGLGDGAWIYGPVVREVQSQLPAQPNGPPPTLFVLFAVRYTPGASPAAAYASLRRDFGRSVLRPLPGEDAVNLQSVDRLPLVLAGFVVLIGVITVGNALVTSVRRRRRDLAILKTIGFTRRQVAGAVAWQATSFALVAAVVGIPLGIAAGRQAWDLVASNINSVSPALVPATSVALIAPATVAVCVVVAALPSWSAARVRPAVALRTE